MFTKQEGASNLNLWYWQNHPHAVKWIIESAQPQMLQHDASGNLCAQPANQASVPCN